MMQSLPRFAVLALTLALLAGVSVGRAQDQAVDKVKEPGEKAKFERLIYNLQRGSAKDIAKILSTQFKGSTAIEALPESFGNCLLIYGPAGEVAELQKLLGTIDRKPQTILVEIIFAEIPPKKDEAGKDKDKDGAPKTDKPVKELELEQFTGPAPAVLANIRALSIQGRITNLRRARLTVVENMQSTMSLTENKPLVTGVTTTATGLVSRNISYHPVGEQAKLTARVQADKKIDLELENAISRLEADPAVPLGKDEKGEPIMATVVVNSRFTSKLSLTSGNAVAADNVAKTAKGEGVRSRVIVTAKIIDPNAAPASEDTAPTDGPRTPFGRPRRERQPRPVPPPPPAASQQ